MRSTGFTPAVTPQWQSATYTNSASLISGKNSSICLINYLALQHESDTGEIELQHYH